MHRYVIFLFSLILYSACGFHASVKQEAPSAEELPWEILWTPVKEYFAARNGDTFQAEEHLFKKADSLYLTLLQSDSIKRYPRPDSLYVKWPRMTGRPLSNERLLAAATDASHDSLMARCLRIWRNFFRQSERPLRRIFHNILARELKTKNLNGKDAALILTAETKRFMKGLYNGYVFRLMADDSVRVSCRALSRMPTIMYYNRVYLRALDKALTEAEE